AQGRELEEVGNTGDQDRILAERPKPKLRQPLRIAVFALGAGPDGTPARFVTELAAHQRAQGHEVAVFAPVSTALAAPRDADGVRYEPLPVYVNGDPLGAARTFADAAEARLRDLPSFDLLHVHEWMAGLLPSAGTRPTVLSITSVEATRRNGSPATPVSRAIEQAERDVARTAGCLLTP